MAKILTFRNKGDAPSGQDFLTDGAQTLSFRTSEDGAVSLGDITAGLSGLFPDPKKDWSNQELADLFRVRQLLSAANVPVETDRGVTDEGDPWFVFCHANGEVFIHLCRIDGAYVLDSPNVLRPLRGADFNGLIADFTNQAIPAQKSEDDPERRVIRLERGGKVRLHPSAMLAALIWTLFLASEELVLLAPEETDSDALLDFDGMFAIETPKTATVDLIFEEDSMDFAQLVKDSAIDTHHDVLDHGQGRETQHQQGLTAHNNAFTMGLSTIAIAMGFMSETVLLDNQRKVLENLKELGFSEYRDEAHHTAELDIAADAEGSALLEMLADFLGLDLSLNTKLADAGNGKANSSDAAQDLSHLTGDMGTDDAPIAVKVTAPVAIRNKGDKAEKDVTEARVEVSSDLATLDSVSGNDTLTAEAEQDTVVQTLNAALQGWPAMEEIKLGNLTFKSNSSLSEEDAFALFDWIVETTSPDLSTNYREFDSVAQRLIEFLEAKDGNIYFLQSSKGVVMIDITAQTGGETATLHWEAEDGRTISFVGLQADFEQFDMIA